MEERSPPVAVRVIRPYADEAKLLEAEVGAFSRTGIVLVGAPSRPNGVVLRFEMCLRDGTAVMRGEGRVVGYRAPTAHEEGALMLRFTRLDVKSKALLDRAVALREERRSLAPPPPPPRPEAPPAPSAPPPRPSVAPPASTGSIAPRVALPSAAPVAAHEPAHEPAQAEPSEPSASAQPEEPVAEPAPGVAMPEPATPSTTEELDDDDVEEIDPEEVHAEEDGGLTEQAPPVAFARPVDPLDASTQEVPAAVEAVAVEAAAPAVADAADVVPEEQVDAAPSAPPPVVARVEAAEPAADVPRPAALARLAGRHRQPPPAATLDADGRRAALDRLRARAVGAR